jgi:hypothetical protein
VRAFLAIASAEEWGNHMAAAFSGRNPDEGMRAYYGMIRWLNAGIAQSLPSIEPAALELRLKSAFEYVAADATKRVEELVMDCEKAGDSNEHRTLLGRALLLLSRRQGEDGDDDAALRAAQRAEKVLATIGDDAWRAQAVRAQAAAMLRQRKIDDALALFDGVIDAQEQALRVEGNLRLAPPSDPTLAVLHEASRTMRWAHGRSPAWIRDLGLIAERTGHEACGERFEAGLRWFAAQAEKEPEAFWNPGADGLRELVRAQGSSVRIARRGAELLAELFPMNITPANEAGQFFIMQGDFENAARLYARMIDAYPHATIWWGNAISSAAGKWPPDALEVLRAALVRAKASLTEADHVLAIADIEKKLGLARPSR